MSELLQTAFTTFHKRPILLVTLRLLKKTTAGGWNVIGVRRQRNSQTYSNSAANLFRVPSG